MIKKNLLSQIAHFFKRGKPRNLEFLLALATREPANAYPPLKIAEIYEKQGEKKEALSWYLKAAEIFCTFEQYHKGAAIYIRILKQEPNLESVRKKLANTYTKMGLLAQAFTLYHNLYSSYIDAGAEFEPLEMIGQMAELDPHKFTLDEKSYPGSQGSEKIGKQKPNGENKEINISQRVEKGNSTLFDLAAKLETNDSIQLGKAKSVTMEEGYSPQKVFEELNKIRDVEKLYTNYNYHMGRACKEMGLFDEAIKQFQIALEKEQKPIESAKLLSLCIDEKRHLEGRKSFKEMLPMASTTI